MDTPEKPSIDEQIKFISGLTLYADHTTTSEMVRAVTENLITIKRWEQLSVKFSDRLKEMTGYVDVEKVIQDLVASLKFIFDHEFSKPYPVEVRNAEAALGMLQAFKHEREAPKITDAARTQYRQPQKIREVPCYRTDCPIRAIADIPELHEGARCVKYDCPKRIKKHFTDEDFREVPHFHLSGPALHSSRMVNCFTDEDFREVVRHLCLLIKAYDASVVTLANDRFFQDTKAFLQSKNYFNQSDLV